MTYQTRSWRLFAFFLILTTYAAGTIMLTTFLVFDKILGKPIAADPFVVLLTAQGWSGPLSLVPEALAVIIVVVLSLLLARRLYLGFASGRLVAKLHWSVSGMTIFVALTWLGYATIFCLDKFASQRLLLQPYVALVALPNYFLTPLLIILLELYTTVREILAARRENA